MATILNWRPSHNFEREHSKTIRWAKKLSFWHPFISEIIKFSMKNFLWKLKGNKGLHRVKQNTTITCRQSKVEQVYIKSESGHSILLDTVNCCTQKYTGNRNLLDQLYFAHLSRFTVLSIKYWMNKYTFHIIAKCF